MRAPAHGSPRERLMTEPAAAREARLPWYVPTLAILWLALRFVLLEHSPPGFYGDEIRGALNAICLGETGESAYGERWPFFVSGAGAGIYSPPFLYFSAGWAQLFGTRRELPCDARPSSACSRSRRSTAGCGAGRARDRGLVGLRGCALALVVQFARSPWIAAGASLLDAGAVGLSQPARTCPLLAGRRAGCARDVRLPADADPRRRWCSQPVRDPGAPARQLRARPVLGCALCAGVVSIPAPQTFRAS